MSVTGASSRYTNSTDLVGGTTETSTLSTRYSHGLKQVVVETIGCTGDVVSVWIDAEDARTFAENLLQAAKGY